MPRARLSLLGLAALAVFSVGCGPKGPAVNFVEGKVTLNGSPLAGATVMFSPVKDGGGRAASGVTDASGVYKLTDMQAADAGGGAAEGEYQVAITKAADAGGDTTAQTGSDYEYNPNPNAPVALKTLVPEQYTRPETSGLTATVTAGRNEINFDLTGN